MTIADTETQVLESIAMNLEAEGYSVYVYPSSQLIPAFMKEYIPDAIAFGAPKNIAIEVVVDTPSSIRKVRRLQELFKDSNDWEFRVYYARPRARGETPRVANQPTIEASLAAVENMQAEGLLSPALLMAWATLEAIARGGLPDKFARPQPPGRLVEVLATEGYVTPSEADRLRQLAKVRNRLVHGDLEARVSARDLSRFVQILKVLPERLPRRE